MKKKVVSLLLTAILCLVFAVPVFAEETQYRGGQDVAFSGHTDFDYYYTYTAGTSNVNFKCFSVVENGQRVYASVRENLYEYYRKVFNDQDVRMQGRYQQTAGDGAPVIMVDWFVTTNEKGKDELTALEEYVAPALYEKGTDPDFIAIP